MKRTWKKAAALVLTLCTALCIRVPAVGTAGTEDYVFPAYGTPTHLGTHLTNDLSITEYAARLTYQAKDYLLVPARGGILYTFALTDYLEQTDNDATGWIYDQVDTGIGVPRGIAVDSQNVAYTVGDSASVAVYDIRQKSADGSPLVKVTLPESTSISGVTVDNQDNVFVSTSSAMVYKIVRDSTQTSGYRCDLLYDADEALISVSTLVWGEGYIYAQGPRKGTDGSVIYKLDPATGAVAGQVVYENTGGLYYLSYIDGILFGGSSGTIGDGMIAVDTATMGKTTITLEGADAAACESGWIMGAVTNPENGYSYMVINGLGLWKYDTAARTATAMNSNTGTNLRVRDPYVTVGSSKFLLTLSSRATPYLLRLEGSDSVPSMAGLTTGAVSTWTARSIGPGVPGTDVAVYVGGYLTGSVASYTPGAAEPINSTVFSNGHAQTDSLMVYNGKVYGGAYYGGYLFEYDPATDTLTELIHGLGTQYNQIRIHALAAGDNKIFFSTVPKGQVLGGAIGWYDLTTDTYTVKENVVPDQIVISLVYDEEANILYGSTSTSGGTDTTPTQDEAFLMVYDIANETLLGNFSVRSSANPNSDMVFDTDNGELPRYIDGIAADPSGKLWGLVSRTLFSFCYDRTGNTLTVTEEYAGAKNLYTNSASLHWFPRPILFDGNGNLYVYLVSDGLRRFTVNDLSDNEKLVSGSRIYTLGNDSNLYYAVGTELYRIALTRPTIVEDLIANASDQASIDEAQSAYNALTDMEKSQVSMKAVDALNVLKGNSCAVEQNGAVTYSTLESALPSAASGTTIRLIADCTGNIAVPDGVTLDLGGKTVTGNVTGTVTDSSNGTGGVTGTVIVPQSNSQIPLLDGDTYRFFDCSVQPLIGEEDPYVPGQVNAKFWMVFTNADAYSLLANGQGTNLSLSAAVVVDGVPADSETVSVTVTQQWADGTLSVVVSGVPDDAPEVTVTLSYTASGAAGSIAQTVSRIVAYALYGLWPSDLITG